MNNEIRLKRHLKEAGYPSASPEVLRIFEMLAPLPTILHRIPEEVQEVKANYLALVEHLERAIKAARHLERGLPPPPTLGLDDRAIERSWERDLTTILESVRAKVPRPLRGRPRKTGEELIAVGVKGALERSGVPPNRISALTTDCLYIMGMKETSIDRAVRTACRRTKSPPK